MGRKKRFLVTFTFFDDVKLLIANKFSRLSKVLKKPFLSDDVPWNLSNNYLRCQNRPFDYRSELLDKFLAFCQLITRIMDPRPIQPSGHDAYSDEQVLHALRSGSDRNHLVLKWFFNQARAYALGYLQKKYPDLNAPEWDVVFANVNLKLITRVRNGLQLTDNTRLTTYYTSVAKFAALDFLADRKATAYVGVEADQVQEKPKVLGQLEDSDRSRQIQAWLQRIVGNEEQVKVMLLQAKGYSFKEIVALTSYHSAGACRNAVLKGKNRVSEYLAAHPAEAEKLRALLL